MDSVNPRARTLGLIVEALGDDRVVYDLERDVVHTLNQTASVVFEACDGTRDLFRLSQVLAERTPLPPSLQVVVMTLRKLDAAHLLDRSIPLPEVGITRRDLLRQLKRTAVVTAAALPVVTSLIAPPPVAAASAALACDLSAPQPTGGCGPTPKANMCAVIHTGAAICEGGPPAADPGYPRCGGFPTGVCPPTLTLVCICP